MQRAVGIAGLYLREVGAPDLVVGLEHGAKVLLRLRIGEPDSRAPIVEDDHGPISEHDFGEELPDSAVTSGTQGMDVAHAGPV